MATAEDNAALLRAAVEAANRGEIHRLPEFLHPEIEVKIASGLGNPGTWHGIEGYTEMAAAWLEAFEGQRIEIIETEAPATDWLVAEVRLSATGAASGAPVAMTFFYLSHIRDGRADRFEIHGSRDSALAAVGRS